MNVAQARLRVVSEPVPIVWADPRACPRTMSPWLERRLQGMLHDPRDAGIVQDLVRRLPFVGVALAFFVPGVFWWPVALLYLALLIPQCGPTAVVMHMMSHRPLFTKRYRGFERAITWFVVMFFGLDPGTYRAYHLGMHHVEDNAAPDTSSTRQYRRDSLWQFGQYWLRFQLTGKLEMLAYLIQRRRFKLVWRSLRGELLHKGVIGVALLLNPGAALVVFILPHIIVRFGLMMGNWCHHAFIDPEHPDDPYANSATLINCPYNMKMYNDGYHCGHHVRANTHWADAPARFEADLANYRARRAVVFDGLRGFPVVWWYLMTKRYDVLAQHLVPWSDDLASIEARVAFLRSRVAPVRSAVDA